MKRFLLFISLCTFALAGCSDNEETTATVASSVAVESIADSAIKQEDVDKIQSALEEGYSNYYDVRYFDETMTFHLTPKDGTSETDTLKKVANNPNDAEHEKTIKEMAGSLVEMSNIIEENIAEGINIELDNPNENGESLFIFSNGQVEYPILK